MYTCTSRGLRDSSTSRAAVTRKDEQLNVWSVNFALNPVFLEGGRENKNRWKRYGRHTVNGVYTSGIRCDRALFNNTRARMKTSVVLVRC